jgi:hypothetical protein
MSTTMRTRLLIAIVALVALGLAVAGCGGSDSGGSTADRGSAVTGTQEQALAKADANCRLMLSEIKHFAQKGLTGFKNNVQAVTIGFGKPGLVVARRTRARQQKLVDAVDDKAFETYVGLFDPIILFAQQSIAAARIEDIRTVTNLKEKLTTLGTEQSIVADEAGLPACEIDFLDAMVRAASE